MQPTDIRKLMAGMRFEPKTAQQWKQAEAGAAACDQDWNAADVKCGDALIGWNRHYRAAYELRYHELIAANAGWLYGREPYPGREATMVQPATAQHQETS